MRTRTTVFAVLLSFLVLVLLGGCGPGKYVPRANEEIYGSWTNEKMEYQKVVVAPESEKMYIKLDDTTSFEESSQQIVSRWTDSEGNVWYKCSNTRNKGPHSGTKFARLDKLSKSGTVWESVWTAPANDEEMKNPKYPIKIDPQDSLYNIYYRTKE
jgi:hypothetical protein